MRDYVREMMDVWTNDGDQAAYDLGAKLLQEIESEISSLRTQSAAVSALGLHLQDAGSVNVVEKETRTLDIVQSSERPRLILDAAQNIGWLNQGKLVKVHDVLNELNGRGLDLGVKQPLAVIGTVLARSNSFTKVARNTFEYHSNPKSDPVDDLPF